MVDWGKWLWVLRIALILWGGWLYFSPPVVSLTFDGPAACEPLYGVARYDQDEDCDLSRESRLAALNIDLAAVVVSFVLRGTKVRYFEEEWPEEGDETDTEKKKED